MWKFKKHILKTADSQAAPSCPDRAVVIQVCNQNSAMDDNFNVFLNGTYIGFLDLDQNAQVGSIMIATTNTNANVLVGDFACPLTLMQTYRFNPSLLLFGPNTLEMRNAQVNNNGNAGTVSIRNYEVVDNDLINPCVIADLTYSGANGASFTMVFNYTACCPGELDETIIATKDTYTTTFGSGLSGANILVNDSLNGNSVTISNVSITQVYSSNPSVSINTTTGEIIAAANTPVGEHTLVYEICEVGNSANCDQTTIKVIITAAPTTTAAPASISIATGSPTCRSTGSCSDNSTCGVILPVNITGAPIGYYVESTILASSGATATYSPTQIEYVENNSAGTVTVKLDLYDSFGGAIIASTQHTLSHQASYPFLTTCTTSTTTTTTTTTQPASQNYYYMSVHPEAHAGTDYVVYIDEFGVEQTHTLIRDDINGNPCEIVYAQSIVQVIGAVPCTP